ncbi:hypothetical protein [Polaribacter sp.]|jgi:hypothetical protein|uniref:hypothetical protein n=1 Tax=Polaribacter sp. TaxID=1920175 RepID=UPI003ADE2466
MKKNLKFTELKPELKTKKPPRILNSTSFEIAHAIKIKIGFVQPMKKSDNPL